MAYIGTKKLDRQCLDDIPGLATGYGSAYTNSSQTGHSSSRQTNYIAHNDLTGQGTDITGRDVTLVGHNVSLLPSEDATKQAQHRHESHLGITLAASGVAVQAAQAADSAIAAHDRGDNRLAALYAAEAAYGASDAADIGGQTTVHDKFSEDYPK